jgi:hypothetical protein
MLRGFFVQPPRLADAGVRQRVLKLRLDALGRKLFEQRAGGDYKAAVRRWL